MTDNDKLGYSVCFCIKSTRWQLLVIFTKLAVCYLGYSPFVLCYFVLLVVDHLLSGCFLISGGFFMVVHMLFWGYSLVILFALFHWGFASGSCCCFLSSVAFFLFFQLSVYFWWYTCSVYLSKKIKHQYSIRWLYFLFFADDSPHRIATSLRLYCCIAILKFLE